MMTISIKKLCLQLLNKLVKFIIKKDKIEKKDKVNLDSIKLLKINDSLKILPVICFM